MTIDHIGVVVPDIDQAIKTYKDLFGYSLLSGPFDDPAQQAKVCFVGTDSDDKVLIELIVPLVENSHVARLLARGGGAYHVCYKVADIDQTLDYMREKGCLVVSNPVPAVAYGGRRIAWFYTPTRQLVELVER